MSDDTFLVAPWPLVCDDCTKALANHVYDRCDLDAVAMMRLDPICAVGPWAPYFMSIAFFLGAGFGLYR